MSAAGSILPTDSIFSFAALPPRFASANSAKVTRQKASSCQSAPSRRSTVTLKIFSTIWFSSSPMASEGLARLGKPMLYH